LSARDARGPAEGNIHSFTFSQVFTAFLTQTEAFLRRPSQHLEFFNIRAKYMTKLTTPIVPASVDLTLVGE
jgi:hypothetical protein